jgi:hypothetical protein
MHLKSACDEKPIEHRPTELFKIRAFPEFKKEVNFKSNPSFYFASAEGE